MKGGGEGNVSAGLLEKGPPEKAHERGGGATAEKSQVAENPNSPPSPQCWRTAVLQSDALCAKAGILGVHVTR